jgi:hypothetical protein
MHHAPKQGITVYPAGYHYDYWVSSGLVALDTAQLQSERWEKTEIAFRALQPFKELCGLKSLDDEPEYRLAGISVGYYHPELSSLVHLVIAEALGVELSILPIVYDLNEHDARSEATGALLRGLKEYRLPDISSR